MWYDGPPAAGAAAAASCHARGSRRRGVPCWLASSRRCRYPPGACGAPAAAGSSSAWRCRARARRLSARAPAGGFPPARLRHQGSGNIQACLNSRVLHPAARMLQAGKVGCWNRPGICRPPKRSCSSRRPRGGACSGHRRRMWQARRVTGNALGDSPCLGRPARRCAPSTRSPAATAQTSRSGGMQSDDARCADGRPAHMACRIG